MKKPAAATRHTESNLQNADVRALLTTELITAKFRSDAVILFGSRARGDHRPNSDTDMLLLRSHTDSNDDAEGQSLSEAATAMSKEIYGTEAVPEVDVTPMLTGVYQRTKNSRNFLAAKVATDGIIFAKNPGHFQREPGDHNMEPLFARQAADRAIEATTVFGDWRRHYPEEDDDLAVEALAAINNAHVAAASAAGVNLAREDTVTSIRKLLTDRGIKLKPLLIDVEDYYQYHDHPGWPIADFINRGGTTAMIRRDVQRILATSPELHRSTMERWEHWKRFRRNHYPQWRDGRRPL